jgi:hypothetical protein
MRIQFGGEEGVKAIDSTGPQRSRWHASVLDLQSRSSKLERAKSAVIMAMGLTVQGLSLCAQEVIYTSVFPLRKSTLPSGGLSHAQQE